MKQQELSKWYSMDNSGMIYPIIETLTAQSNFRMSFRLHDLINPDILLKALIKAYERFPYYKVKIERGLFRHYLVENLRPPLVFEDNGLVLGRVPIVKNHYYPILVTYWQCNVYITFFHGLGDGSGAMTFLRYLMCAYLRMTKGECMPDPDEVFPVLEGETENAFETYYKKSNFSKGLNSMAGGNAAQVKGQFFTADGSAITQGRIDVATALAVARAHGCSLTVLIAAAALLASVRTLAKVTRRNRPLVFIPINLRKQFPSNTMQNFVGTTKCVIGEGIPEELDAYIGEIKAQLAAQTTKEELETRIAFTSLLSKNPILRYAPLSVKMALSKVVRELTHSTKQTMICSNVGAVSLPAEVAKEVEDVYVILNTNHRTPLNMAIVSFGDGLVVTFTRQIIQSNVEREFFAIMRGIGLDMCVSSNYREVNHAM